MNHVPTQTLAQHHIAQMTAIKIKKISGFTLVESLISVAILSGAILSIIYANQVSLRKTNYNLNKLQATYISECVASILRTSTTGFSPTIPGVSCPTTITETTIASDGALINSFTGLTPNSIAINNILSTLPGGELYIVKYTGCSGLSINNYKILIKWKLGNKFKHIITTVGIAS